MDGHRELVDKVYKERWWTAKKILGLMVVFGALGLGGAVIGSALGWFREVATVVKEEVGPKALLIKYEWFKDAAAQLDRKQSDIAMFEARVKSLEETKDLWTRHDKALYSQWTSELLGVRSSYNDLAAQYNAAMAKINWAFANVGDLPEGVDEVLPREFRTYEGE